MGLEPRLYEPEKWNDDEDDVDNEHSVQKQMNCYAYALDFPGEITYGVKQEKNISHINKPQPGDFRDYGKTCMLSMIYKNAKVSENMPVLALSGAMLDASANQHTFRVASEDNINGIGLGKNEWTVMLVATVIPEGVSYDDYGMHTKKKMV